MTTFLRSLQSEKGAEIAEAALVLPLVFLFMLGMIWFGRAFNINATIEQAAQQGVVAAARDSCSTCPTTTLANNAAAADAAVMAALSAAHIDIDSIIEWDANNPSPGLSQCPSPAPPPLCAATSHHVWVCSSVRLNLPAQPPECGALVSFKYPFTFTVPFASRVVMSAQAQSRMEN